MTQETENSEIDDKTIIELAEDEQVDKTQLDENTSENTNSHFTTSNLEPDDPDHTQVASGAVLKDRFDLLEVIGQGGMGSVYKAVDRRDIEAGNSKFIAIKVLKEQLKSNPHLLKALHAETRKTQSLAHPNIVTVYDFDRDDSTVFMTMEFIDGAPLTQLIKSKPKGSPVEEVLPIVQQIGSALIYAHSQHIIHLDLKPSNVFIDPSRHIKVFDFGIARVNNVFQTDRFDAGILGGLTPSYASLEMFEQKEPDPRDDIYALACMTYELLAGFHPYNRERADKALERNIKPQKIKSLNKKQWKTLEHALQLKRHDRLETVEEFIEGMQAEPSKKLPFAVITGTVTALGLVYLVFALFISKPDLNNAPDSPPQVTKQETALVEKTVIEKTAVDKTIAPKPAEQTIAQDSETQQSQMVETPNIVQATETKTEPGTDSFITLNEAKNVSDNALDKANELLSQGVIETTPPPIVEEIMSETIQDDEVQQVVLNTAKNEDRLPTSKSFHLKLSKTTYKIGDPFVLEFMTNKAEHITILIINTVGEVSLLYPNDYQTDSHCQPGIIYQVPALNADFELNIEGPAGQDYIIAIKSQRTLNTEAFSMLNGKQEVINYLENIDLSYKSLSFKIVE